MSENRVDCGPVLRDLDQLDSVLAGMQSKFRQMRLERDALERVAALIAAAERLRWCISRSLPPERRGRESHPVFVLPL
jgi:hypothetical protein